MSTSLPKFSWIVPILIVIVVGLVAWFGLRITQITCVVDNHDCDASLTSHFDNLRGQHILFFNDRKLIDDTNLDSQYKLERISFKLPGTIVLMLNHQTVAYQLAADGQTDLLIISSSGLVMTTSNQSSPRIYVSPDIWNQVKSQNSVDANFHEQLMDILATLQTNKQTTTNLTWVDAQTVALDNPGQPQIILDPTNLRTDLARLKITQQASQNQPAIAQAAEIDVRFQLPVVRTTASIPRHQAP